MLPSLIKKWSKTLPLRRSIAADNEQHSSMSHKESNAKAERVARRKANMKELDRDAEEVIEPPPPKRRKVDASAKDDQHSSMSRKKSNAKAENVVHRSSKELSLRRQSTINLTNETTLARKSSKELGNLEMFRRTSKSISSTKMGSGSKQTSKKIPTPIQMSTHVSDIKAPPKQMTKRMSKVLSSAAKSSPSLKVKATEGRNKKILWYLCGTYVTVRNDKGGWFLCRLSQNAYNTSKSISIRWLSIRMERGADGNTYRLDYADKIDPACILLNVQVTRNGTKYHLLPADKLETEKLMKLAEHVAKGKATMKDLDSDVEEVIQIEPPPPKKRKVDATAKQKKKKEIAGKKVKTERKKREPREKKQKKETGEKKSRGKKAESSVPKRKKATKKELELLLHPKPSIKIQDKDIFFETSTSVPFVSKFAHSKLVFRAVYMKDTKLLKKLLKDNLNIRLLHHSRSVAVSNNALMEAVIGNNKEAVDLLMRDHFFDLYKDRMKNNLPDKILLDRLGTGKYNFRSLGVHFIRQLTASRGSREGNNALIKDLSNIERGMDNYKNRYRYIWCAIKHGADFDMIKMLSRLNKDDGNMILLESIKAFDACMKYGHPRLAAQMLEKASAGHLIQFQPMHIKALTADNEAIKSCPPSQVRQQVKKIFNVTPVHCASINPDKQHLERLLSVQPDFHCVDRKGRRPVHFAAACYSTGPLEHLLKIGANPYDTDSEGLTPLFYAVEANRAHNVELLLKVANDKTIMFQEPAADKFGIGGVNRPNRSGKAPIHVSVEDGYIDIVRILVKYGAAVDLPLPVSKFKVTPLMIASGCGNLPLAKFLVQQGSTVQLKDRLGRTSVVHAAMNGSTNVLSFLLNIGADPNRGDNSANTPLHYACGYGWYFCVKLLLEAEADANVGNDWKTTPLSIAYMKGHLGIVNLLLTDAGVDVNFQDDQGMTLVSIASSSVLYSDLYEQIIYLIKDKGADCTLHDVNGCTPLHYLAKNSILLDGTEKNPLPCDESMDTSVKIAKALLENGCNPMALNDFKESALDHAVITGNIKLVEYLINKGCCLQIQPDDNNMTLLHNIAVNHMQCLVDKVAILKFLMKQKVGVKGVKQDFCAVLSNMAKVVDHKGHLPIILACNEYSCCKKTSSSTEENADQVAAKTIWQRGRDFIKFLVEELNSDVNAFVHKRHYENEKDRPEKEEDQYEKGGLMSVVHYLANIDRCEYGNLRQENEPVYPCLRMILKYKPKVNVRNIDGHTPLTRAVDSNHQNPAEILLMESNADPNSFYLKTTKHNIPVVILAALNLNHMVMKCLVKRKAELDVKDPRDKASALHIAITKGDQADGTLKMLNILLDGGANVNITDEHKRTPLHLAVNLNYGGMNSNFDIEIFLLKHHASLNLRDIRGRLPLHYVFVKRKKCTDKSEVDPVDLCRLLVSSMNSVDLQVKDMFGQTCLHRAAFRGGKISCMYLLQKGLKINEKDNNGNTPLTMSMLGSHDSCATILIQNGASVKDPIIEMTDQKPQIVEDNTDDEEESDMDDESDDDSVTARKEEKKKKTVVKPGWKWKPLPKSEVVGSTKKTPLFEMAVQKEMQGVCFLVLQFSPEKSGVTFTDAIEIGLKLQKYNVVLRLIGTTVDTSSLKQKRQHGRNMLHILALTVKVFDHLVEKVVDKLISLGVSLVDEDDYRCTPLLYASLKHVHELGKYFLKTPGVYKPKYRDSFNRSILTVCFWKGSLDNWKNSLIYWINELLLRNCKLDDLFDFPLPEGSMFGEELLQEPDYWQKYPQCQISPLIMGILQHNFYFTQWLLKKGSNPNFSDSQNVTPLMYAARINDLNLVKVLLNYTFDPEAKEPKPVKPVKPLKQQSSQKLKMHGRIFRLKKKLSESDSSDEESSSDEEDEDKQKNNKSPEIKTVKKTSSVNVNLSDKNGWTVLHHIACPLTNGSFDNDEMVYVLHKVGLRLNTKDNNGDTALDIALRSGAVKVARMIQKLEKVDERNMKSLKLQPVTVNDNVKWSTPPPSLDDDVDAMLQSILDEPLDIDFEFIPEINSHCNITNGTLVKDTEQGVLYDVLLTKVDVNQSVWGLYNFYQIQLVYQPGKDLYILFTRWGRIGDDGQFQHTPYQEKEKGIKEFCKVFREKTGNKWCDVKKFEQQPKKYRLVPESAQRHARKQKDIRFKHKSGVPSKLPKHLHRLMKELTNVKSIKAALHHQDMDSEVMPFGKMDSDRLLKARNILEEISVCVEEVEEYRQKYNVSSGFYFERNRASKQNEGKTQAEIEEKEKATAKYQTNCEKIAILSSEYFQTIPQKSYAFEKIRPLDKADTLKKQMSLVSNLLQFEVACKMLLGAMYRKKEINPLDYVYQAMGCKVELLKEDDWDSQYILKYIFSSGKHFPVEAIYRVEIPGEEQRMKKKNVGNHKLLWHGSGIGNILSILHRGLVIAPPEAPISGHAFGKGIYFSDCFSKSSSYCWSPTTTHFMLLCEVALGKEKLFTNQYFKTERLEKGFHSVHAVGICRPEEKHSVYLSTGVQIPLGRLSRNNFYNEQHCMINNNEFIIFEEEQVCVRYLVQFRI